MPASVDLKNAHVEWVDGTLRLVAQADVEPELQFVASYEATRILRGLLGEASSVGVVIHEIDMPTDGAAIGDEELTTREVICEIRDLPTDIKARTIRGAVTTGLQKAEQARTKGNAAAAALMVDLAKKPGLLG